MFFSSKVAKVFFRLKKRVLSVRAGIWGGDVGLLDAKNLDILPDEGDRVRLRDGTIGLVTFVEISNREESKREVQVEVIDENNSNNKKSEEKEKEHENQRTVTLVDMIENLGRDYSQWNLESASEQLLNSLRVGDHVRLVNGKTGEIRYIGTISQTQEEMVGIALDSYSDTGHNGNGKFDVAHGYGYFCYKSDVREKIGVERDKAYQERLQTKRHRYIAKLKRQLGEIESQENKVKIERQLVDLESAVNGNKPYVEIDEIVKRDVIGKGIITMKDIGMKDRVTLDSSEVGAIVFIGDVDYDDRKMLGILLNEYSPNGHDGSVDGKVYFGCEKGYGLLVPTTSIVKVDKHVEDENRDLFIKYFQQRHEIEELFQDCSLETNIWDNSSYSDLCSKYRSDHGDYSIIAMIHREHKKMNSFTKRCKKGIQTVWNSFRRSMSFLDLFTDIRLLYLVSIAIGNDPQMLIFVIVLSVSLVCPYIVSYSCGIKLFHINRDNNYDIKNLTQSNSFDGYVALKKIIAYLSLSPVGVFYFLLLDLIDIIFVYYKLFAIIFLGKNEMEMKLLEEMVAKQLGMSRMDYEGIKRQRATAQLSLVFFFCYCFGFFVCHNTRHVQHAKQALI